MVVPRRRGSRCIRPSTLARAGGDFCQGAHTVTVVGAGRVELRVLRVGYSEQHKRVTVTGGETATADFQMAPVAVMLDPVVTTATGEARRVEVGHGISRVDAETVTEQKPVSTVEDVLTARPPGVRVMQVMQGTQTGAVARVRIRGRSSLSLSSDPIYIVVGARVANDRGSASFTTGGTYPSRSLCGYMDATDFVRLPKLSLTFNAPESWAGVLRGQRLSASLAARNLGLLFLLGGLLADEWRSGDSYLDRDGTDQRNVSTRNGLLVDATRNVRRMS